MVGPLVLERAEETLHDGVAVATHAGRQTAGLQPGLHAVASVGSMND